MKKLLFVLLFTPLSILGQNYKRVEEKPATFVEIAGQRHYVTDDLKKVIKTVEISCNNIDCVIEKAKRLTREKKFVEAMRQLNCARYYVCPTCNNHNKLMIIDSLSINLVNILVR